MDQKRLFIAIAISIGILLLFDLWNRPAREAEQRRLEQQRSAQPAAPTPGQPAAPVPLPATPGAAPVAVAPGVPGQAAATATPLRPEPQRVVVDAPRVAGSLNLRGARLDNLVLKDHRETVDRGSPPVRLLAPRTEPHPYFGQWGWAAADGRTRVPDQETDWTAEGGPLAPDRPVTLRWDNGEGQEFRIHLEIDADYMLLARQTVVNRGSEPVQVLPWARIRREATPQTAGFYILHEGFVGVLDGRLQEWTYSAARDEANKRRGPAFEQESAGGWAGFTDKYWLTALTPEDQATRIRTAFRHVNDGADRWQVDIATPAPVTVAPGAESTLGSRLYAGAKEVALLDAYEARYGILDFWKAIDFGWFWFLTKPFFHILHFIAAMVGNYGVAILIFTLMLKILFFPLANKAYRSMGKMKVLGPKMQEIKERYKDDPSKAQAEMMALYKSEKVNPASGCLPILIQIPVFFALYKVLFVTIEMRHAPFFGWIHDLSAPDPTNLFNLFGLLPFDPMVWSSLFHMPVWAILMGITMFLQFKLNPTPPDPIQAKIFAWMPLIFTFMLASFPAGLVIYWTWNNLLSIGQQWYIQRNHGGPSAKPAAAPPPPKAVKKG